MYHSHHPTIVGECNRDRTRNTRVLRGPQRCKYLRQIVSFKLRIIYGQLVRSLWFSAASLRHRRRCRLCFLLQISIVLFLVDVPVDDFV